MADEQKIELSTSDVVNALLHAKQSEHHYATQESVDNLKEQMNVRFQKVDNSFEQVDKRFEQVDKRFEQVDKRFEQVDKSILQLDKKLDRLQWFIVAACLVVIFKDNILKFLG